ncbi:prolyl oligopeptidase family serine peptidase [Brevundimonas staleyi]|uniref:S9 family peptidase n=1 Tax=Brevundimonas staleyi TaxID=74326 RepID=A0ABW0FVT5_9CAUL
MHEARVAALALVVSMAAAQTQAQVIDRDLANRVYDRPGLTHLATSRPVVPSPDGAYAVYGVQATINPDASGGRFQPNGAPVQSAEGVSLFLVDLRTRESRPICPGAGNDWNPSWSPDSGAVAFYSDRSGGPRLWLYDPASEACRPLGDHPVKSLQFPHDHARWSPDGTELYIPVWPAEGPGALAASIHVPRSGLPPLPDDLGVSVFRHSPGSNSAPDAAVSVTDDSLEARCAGAEYQRASLEAVRLSDGSSRVLVDQAVTGALAAPTRHYPSPYVRVSASGRWLSYYSISCRKAGSLYETGIDLYAVPTAGGDPVRVARDLRAPGGGFEFDHGYRWSPATDQIAFLRDEALWRVDFGPEGPGEPVRIGEAAGRLARHILHYLPDGSAVVVGGDAVDGDWAHSRSIRSLEPSLLTVDLSDGVATPIAFDRSRWQVWSLLGADDRIVDGQGTIGVHALDRTSGAGAVVRFGVERPSEAVVWADEGVLESIQPVPGGLIGVYQDFATPADVALIRDGRRQRLSTAAPVLDTLRPGRVERFQTVVAGHDGGLLTVNTAVILPPGARPEAPPPAVVWFYPGNNSSQAANRYGAPVMGDLAHLFTARGYAVVLADMPMQPGGARGHMIDEIVDLLMPQVYRAADLGHVDIRRLALRGQSFGAIATAAVVARTNLFRAAIPSSGAYDLGGLFGQVEYLNGDISDHGIWLETSQPRLGAPLWDDPMRYIANSPYYLADRIRTPMLIIQGTEDFLGYREGGKLFAALRRLDREVELALYDGQGHSPPDWNAPQAADQALRILDFLDRHLTVPATP